MELQVTDMMFVVLMKRLQWGVDPKVPQQFACGAGVLGQDEMRILEHLQGPGGHVAQISHRGGHHNQCSAAHETKVRMIRLANASFNASASGASCAQRDS